MEIPLLREILIIFSLSIVVLLVCHRFNIPSIVGFLLTGFLSGPHGLGLVNIVDNVQTLASVGIILLLFNVGMEFSLKKILHYKKYFLIGGPLQVVLTTCAGICIAKFLERPIGESFFLGFLLSLSSTAIVMRVLDEKGQSDTPHGKLVLGILIFQDIIAIPMMLMVPILTGGEAISFSFIYFFFQGLILLGVVIVSALKIVPKLLYHVTKTRSRELFLLCVLTICFSVAWVTSAIGLSLSLGAFLAGLVISESEYSHEAVGDIIPFQDVFMSFFFVSIGMLLDIRFVLEQPLTILLITFGILCLKSSIAGVTALILGMPIRTAVLAGLALSQIGEFSFVLARSGYEYGIGTNYYYQLFLSVSLMTMAVTPWLIHSSDKIADLIANLPLPDRIRTGFRISTETIQEVNNHLIIVGFGLRGRNLALAAKSAGIPYYILELNSETVHREKEKGEPMHFGDATHSSVLNHARIKEAGAIAVLINDHLASARIIRQAKNLNPAIYLIARTRYLQEAEQMYQLGADDIVPDEFGSSIEILTHVMHHYLLPAENIENFVNGLRAEMKIKSSHLSNQNPHKLINT